MSAVAPDLREQYACTYAEAIDAAARETDEVESIRAFLRVLATGGFSRPTWPVGCGGRGLTPEAAATLESSASPATPSPSWYPVATGTHLVGPTLLVHGTESQQRRWCPPIATGADIWCQMFSEPNAGSDLANVHVSAFRDGEVWRLNGQKVWTSKAHYAHWAICLARTNPDLPKHKGMTMFVVDMRLPGIEVRPLIQMNRDNHFSEVFLQDCEVADDCRVGDVGSGWAVALTTLGFERAAASVLRDDSGELGVPGWMRPLIERGAFLTAHQRSAAVDAYVESMVNELTVMRAAAGSGTGPEGSGSKLRAVAANQAMVVAMNAVAGARGMLDNELGSYETVTAPSMSIRGGTNEIQRNILGERVLGLPPEPRTDRDLAWSEIPH